MSHFPQSKHFGLWLNNDLGSSDLDLRNEPASEYIVMRRTLDTFKSRLNVKRDVLSYTIEVSFQSYDAEKAARIANAVVDAYFVDQHAKYQSTLRASNWLQDRIRDLREQASAGEQAVVDYQREHNIVDAPGKSTNAQRVTELNSQLIIVRAQTAEARARLDLIQAVPNSDSASAVDAISVSRVHELVARLARNSVSLPGREASRISRPRISQGRKP